MGHTALPKSPARVAVSFDDAVAAQTFLDRANFSPGCIDGRWGPRSVATLKSWQNSEGLRATGELDVPTRARLGMTNRTLTVHVVTLDDVEALAPIPPTWTGKAAAARLGYATVLELVAEQYHTTERLVGELNPGVAWPDPPPGTALAVPDPQPSPRVAAARLTISLGRKVVEAWDAKGRCVASFPCSIAADKNKRPRGELIVARAAKDPNYTFDPAVYPEDEEARSIGKRLLLPPGPNNPVGVAWIGLNLPGYGVHGTPKPEDIGKTESHGCFRLANWNAEKLLKLVTIGMPVVVRE
ncbi:MAG TPA: L,D-transpeptidase [Kiritimatiellia bacterium]